jgi:hypothetical protein
MWLGQTEGFASAMATTKTWVQTIEMGIDMMAGRTDFIRCLQSGNLTPYEFPK